MLILSDMSLGDALDLLDSFNLTYALRTIYGDSFPYQAHTFASLGNYYRNRWSPCNKIGPFWALVGPPTKKNWRRVYACQFVADILLEETIEKGEKYTFTKLATMVAIGAP